MTTPTQDQQQQILQLKKRAIECKRGGDIEGAKSLLSQARELEYQNINIEDLNDVNGLKKLAVVLKRRGDIEGAKDCLIKSKMIQKMEEEQKQQRAEEVVPEPKAEEQKVVTVEQPQSQKAEVGSKPLVQQAVSTPPQPQAQSNNNANHDEKEQTTAKTQEPPKPQQEQQEQQEETTSEWTEEDMLDLETLTELKRNDMEVPTASEYQTKILFYKKKALTEKQNGDIEQAKTALRTSKQFQHVMTQLSQINDTNDKEEEMDEEFETWFFAELEGRQDSLSNIMVNDDNDNMLDLDELDQFDDPTMLKDMMDAGMEVPTVAHVMDLSKQQKALALQRKKDGDIDAAKTHLMTSKKLQAKADKLEFMLGVIASNQENECDDEGSFCLEDLEAEIDGKDKPNNKSTTKKEVIPKTPKMTVEEMKQQVLKLKSEKKVKEAMQMLTLLKQTKAKEAQAKEIQRRSELISNMEEELKIGYEQYCLYQFYQRFVNEKVGTHQLSLWSEYMQHCVNVIKTIEERGCDSIEITRQSQQKQLMRISNDNVSEFVDHAIDAKEERLEVCVLSVVDLQDNKVLRKMIDKGIVSDNDSTKSTTNAKPPLPSSSSIRVDLTIQLPPSEEDSHSVIEYTFKPTSTLIHSKQHKMHVFDQPSHYINLPRGRSKYARMIQGRMNRKQIKISIYHIIEPPKPPKRGSSSWFKGFTSSSSSKKEELPEKKETLLGKYSIELKTLLTERSVVGSFPLLDRGERTPVGGAILLGIKTGIPYKPEERQGGDPNEEEEEDISSFGKDANLQPYESMSFRMVDDEDENDVGEDRTAG